MKKLRDGELEISTQHKLLLYLSADRDSNKYLNMDTSALTRTKTSSLVVRKTRKTRIYISTKSRASVFI